MDLRDFYNLSSRFYDADYTARGYEEDIGFYVALAQEHGGPVLEMGCGTGRVLLPTARAGIRIHGMDLAPAMLARLREKLSREPEAVRQRVSVSEGDMRTTRIPGQFALVTSPFRVVQHLLTRDGQRAWLRNVAAHLAPGGLLVFDVFQPNFQFMVEASDGRRRDEADWTDSDGTRVRRSAGLRSFPERQLIEVEFQWRRQSPSGEIGEEHSAAMTVRWFVRGELENLLELEGFEILDFWGSFARQPHGDGSPAQIIHARRKR